MSIVDNIKHIAELNNLSLKKLEEMASLGNGTIRRWDVNSPSIDKLLKIANLLDCDLNTLVYGKDLPLKEKKYDEFIFLIDSLPLDKQNELKGYIKRMLEESVAAGSDKKAVGK